MLFNLTDDYLKASSSVAKEGAGPVLCCFGTKENWSVCCLTSFITGPKCFVFSRIAFTRFDFTVRSATMFCFTFIDSSCRVSRVFTSSLSFVAKRALSFLRLDSSLESEISATAGFCFGAAYCATGRATCCIGSKSGISIEPLSDDVGFVSKEKNIAVGVVTRSSLAVARTTRVARPPIPAA
jgi:hypothetical protein